MPRRRRGTNTGIPGLSFSLRRALGVTRTRQRIAHGTGVPTSRTGLQRKVGAALMGCMMPAVLVAVVLVVVAGAC